MLELPLDNNGRLQRIFKLHSTALKRFEKQQILSGAAAAAATFILLGLPIACAENRVFSAEQQCCFGEKLQASANSHLHGFSSFAGASLLLQTVCSGIFLYRLDVF